MLSCTDREHENALVGKGSVKSPVFQPFGQSCKNAVAESVEINLVSHRDIASLLFALAAVPVDYLAYMLLPSISIWLIGIFTIGLLVCATVLWLTGKKEGKGIGQHTNANAPESGGQSERIFETELSPKEVGLGNILTFKVRFKGILDHALFQAETRLPNGKIHGFPNYDTVSRNPNWFTRGKLTGPYDQVWEWKAPVPRTFRPGEYLFMILAYQRHPYPRLVAVELYVLLWLKAHLIRSIDTKVLYQSEWYPIHQETHHVVISS